MQQNKSVSTVHGVYLSLHQFSNHQGKKKKLKMGNGPSYAKLATIQWYREGTALYGSQGFLANSKSFNNDLDMPPGCMKGKVIAITGSNQGIGYQTAESCAELGADEIHLLCRRKDAAEEAAAKIIKQTGNKNVFCHQLDVSDFKAIRSFADSFSKDLTSRNKRLDVLVNNAGCMPSTLTRTNDEFKHEVITASTLGGCVLLTGLLLPVMTTRSGGRTSESTSNSNDDNDDNGNTKAKDNSSGIMDFGHVINVSSGGQYATCARPDDLDFNTVSESSYDGTLWYAVAKRHQVMITRMMAEKITPKLFAGSSSSPSRIVKFSSMHPGWTATSAVQEAMPDFYNKHKDTLRDLKQGSDTIVFLAAGKSDKIKKSNGDFWFDRDIVRTDMPFSGTGATPEQFELLWKNAIEYCGGNIPALL